MSLSQTKNSKIGEIVIFFLAKMTRRRNSKRRGIKPVILPSEIIEKLQYMLLSPMNARDIREQFNAFRNQSVFYRENDQMTFIKGKIEFKPTIGGLVVQEGPPQEHQMQPAFQAIHNLIHQYSVGPVFNVYFCSENNPDREIKPGKSNLTRFYSLVDSSLKYVAHGCVLEV